MLRQTLTVALLIVVAPQAFGQAAGKKVAEKIGAFVDPTASLDFRGLASTPLARPLPEWLARPQIVAPKLEVAPPAADLPRKPAAPAPAAEGTPLMLNSGSTEPPVATSLATQPLLKQFVVDMRKALDLPVLAVYAVDRVSLADPSMEVSAQTILKPQQPERANPAPFMAWNLPDPFENAETIRLRQPWPENPEPPLFVVSPTRR